MTEAVVVTAKSFPAPETLPLITDVQYREPYSSAAMNRKLRGILTAGIYQGFTPEVGEGLNLIITSGTDGGTVSFDIDAYYQLTVRQQADVTVAMTAGTTAVVALEASYSIGQETYQVNSNSSVPAVQIKLLASGTALAQNQVELCTVTVPAGTTQLTADMIDTSNRIVVAIGVSLGSDVDSEDEQTAANLLGLKQAVAAAKIETATQLTEHVAETNPHKQYLQIANYLSEISFQGADAIAAVLANLGLGEWEKGRLMNVRIITTSGTFHRTPGAKNALIEILGGGGGGGGAQAGNGFASFGAGGAAGSYAKGWFTDIPETCDVIIGAGGTGGGGTENGNPGGTTSFGSLISASGGNPGQTVAAGTEPFIMGSLGAPGTVSGGNVISNPAQNTGGFGFRLSSTACSGGNGADSIYGRGGDAASSTNRAGRRASGYGAGGGGGRAMNQSGTPFVGGNGSDGLAVIWEFA